MGAPLTTVIKNIGDLSRSLCVSVHFSITAEDELEERRLWADYYEAMTRALEILRGEGTGAAALARILAQDAIARSAMARIKQIHRVRRSDSNAGRGQDLAERREIDVAAGDHRDDRART
jgi:hypothetical protein